MVVFFIQTKGIYRQTHIYMNMKCSNCGSTHTVKAGKHRNRKGLYQLWKCKQCAKTMKGGKIS
jgi:transposase-like protein